MEDDEQDWEVDIFINDDFINMDIWHPVHPIRLTPFLLARFPLHWVKRRGSFPLTRAPSHTEVI